MLIFFFIYIYIFSYYFCSNTRDVWYNIINLLHKLYLILNFFVIKKKVTHLSEGCTFIRDNNEAKITDI